MRLAGQAIPAALSKPADHTHSSERVVIDPGVGKAEIGAYRPTLADVHQELGPANSVGDTAVVVFDPRLESVVETI